MADANLASLSGLYTRVARQMGVHPSYVSRVARGERRSDRISRAIATELMRFVPADQAEENLRKPTELGESDFRRRLLRRLKADPQLNRLSTMVIDLEHWGRRGHISRVSRRSLQARIASNAGLIAATVEEFQRMSQRLEQHPHVLSLTDGDGVVLYSAGTTGMVREPGRLPGTNWYRDYLGPNAAARAIAAGVPLIIVGRSEDRNRLLPVRMACPIRLSDAQVNGVVVLSVGLMPVRAEHLIDLSRLARKICKVVENDRKKNLRSVPRSPVQPFE